MATERSWQGKILKYTGKNQPRIGDLVAGQPKPIYPYVANEELIEAVNLAISLERPLLLSGEPGCGKTKIAQAVADELGLPLETWYIRSTSRARDGLYTYDTEGHLRDAQLANHDADPAASQRIKDASHYVRFGPLGRAFLNSQKAVVLIDEIDKADTDFPNDLLLEINEREFCVEETGQVIRAATSPVVFITYNGEKELPPSFLRRCLFYHIPFPRREDLLLIVYSIYPQASSELVDKAAQQFIEMREMMSNDTGKKPGVAEFLDWFQVLERYPTDEALYKLDSTISNLIFSTGSQSVNDTRVERSIEFPPEYREAGTSILSYFSRILSIKYPDEKIKVRIEQEGLILRMIIDSPDGQREKVEKALADYGMVVVGKLQPEQFLEDPFEVMALKNKLEIADLELRQTQKFLDFTRDNSQQRIESLEVQITRLHCIIENGLQSGSNLFKVMGKMAEQDKATYNLNNAKFGGGFAAEGGVQAGGNLIDLSSASNLTEAAQQIQELLQQLQGQGISTEDAKRQAASDLAKQAEANPTVMGKLMKWGQSLADTASKTTVSEAAKGVVKLALQMSGIPLP